MPVLNKSVSESEASTDTLIAAPGAGLKILVWNMSISVQAVEDVFFTDGVTDLYGNSTTRVSLTSSQSPQPVAPPGWPEPMFECGENLPLIVDTVSASEIVYLVFYTIAKV